MLLKNAFESIADKLEIIEHVTENPVAFKFFDSGKGVSKDIGKPLFTPIFITKPTVQDLGLLFIGDILDKQRCSNTLKTGDDGLICFRIVLPFKNKWSDDAINV